MTRVETLCFHDAEPLFKIFAHYFCTGVAFKEQRAIITFKSLEFFNHLQERSETIPSAGKRNRHVGNISWISFYFTIPLKGTIIEHHSLKHSRSDELKFSVSTALKIRYDLCTEQKKKNRANDKKNNIQNHYCGNR